MKSLGTWLWRELRSNIRFNLFFVLNLSLGLTGFTALNAFKDSLEKVLNENSKNFLSADVAVSARRPITESELRNIRNILGPTAKEGELIELFSMAMTQRGSRLVQIRAIDEHYPFYGELKLGSGRFLCARDKSSKLAPMQVWVYPELLPLLGAKVGDKLKLGEAEFTISDTIAEDSSQTFRLATLAPRIYLPLASLEATKLLAFGTTMTQAYLYKLETTANSEDLIARLNKELSDPAIRIESSQSAGEDTARALKYLTDYLGLVALVALFLAALGTGYLFRSFISSRLYSIAILNSLGLTKGRAIGSYLLLLAVLGAIAALVASLLSLLVFPILSTILRELSPLDIPLIVSTQAISVAFLLGSIGSLIIGLPYLVPLARLQTAQLFQEESLLSYQAKAKDFIYILPAVFSYWALGIWQAHSFRIGSYFFLGWIGSLLILSLIGWVFLQLLRPLQTNKRWWLRQAALSLVRKPRSSLIGFVSLALGTLLISLIPQLEVSLKDELQSPAQIKLPSLFVFDVQDDQVEGLVGLLASQGVELKNLSALVRARLLTVNDKVFERQASNGSARSREEEMEQRSRNRGFNLTYRAGLSDSESIEEGPALPELPPKSGELPAVSVETRFADRLGLRLGDVLEFEIQGISVKAKIWNFRNVKWNSFQPNFFIVFQPGILEEAPKTFLGAIGQLEAEQKEQIQTLIVKNYSNVSILDVGRTVKRIFEISEKMAWSLKVMAILSLIAGFVVLFSMVSQQARERQWDLNMFKILGAERSMVHRLVIAEFSILSLGAAIFGTLVSWSVTYALAALVFEGNYQFDGVGSLLRALGVFLVSLLVAFFASRQVARQRPASLLS